MSQQKKVQVSDRVTLVLDPAPNLPPDMRTRLELTMKNGMVTLPPSEVRNVIEHMAGVLVARGDGHALDAIIKRLEELKRAAE